MKAQLDVMAVLAPSARPASGRASSSVEDDDFARQLAGAQTPTRLGPRATPVRDAQAEAAGRDTDEAGAGEPATRKPGSSRDIMDTLQEVPASEAEAADLKSANPRDVMDTLQGVVGARAEAADTKRSKSSDIMDTLQDVPAPAAEIADVKRTGSSDIMDTLQDVPASGAPTGNDRENAATSGTVALTGGPVEPGAAQQSIASGAQPSTSGSAADAEADRAQKPDVAAAKTDPGPTLKSADTPASNASAKAVAAQNGQAAPTPQPTDDAKLAASAQPASPVKIAEEAAQSRQQAPLNPGAPGEKVRGRGDTQAKDAASTAAGAGRETGAAPAEPRSTTATSQRLDVSPPTPAMPGAKPDALAPLPQAVLPTSEVAADPDFDGLVDPMRSDRAEFRAETLRPAAPHAQARMTPAHAYTLAGRMAQQAKEGARVFAIRLDPPELGRVDVRLQMGADRRVNAVLTVERAESLAELQRHARELERGLAEAGLELDEDGLSFQLADPNQQDGHERDGFDMGRAAPVFALTASDAPAQPALSGPIDVYGFALRGGRSLDVRI